MEGVSGKAVSEPWLQDFTASYLERYKRYGPAEVRAQIDAVYVQVQRNGCCGNQGNVFTSGAIAQGIEGQRRLYHYYTNLSAYLYVTDHLDCFTDLYTSLSFLHSR